MSLKAKIRTILTLGRGVTLGLSEEAAGPDPIPLFRQWFEAAEASGLMLPEAMTLATSTQDGVPSARMVLLKTFGDDGFVFYTNHESRKGLELAQNPRVALVLHWAVLERQVRIEGTAEMMTPEESYPYFASRPRGSRVGAWASKQSEPMASRAELANRLRKYERQFRGGDIPIPPFWGGYRVRAHRIEFWQGRANRLHDRLCYVRTASGWESTRLYP